MQFEKLGPYRIGKRIGRGGMGEVYAVVDEESGVPAAVKVLNPALATAEGFRERFEAEIDSLRKLRHPNIVQLYGYGEQDGYLFYAMELIEGRSLESELNAGRRFDWREITDIAIRLCKALRHAHDNGVIHRDIKPGNVVLTNDGDVKLLDFGIARLFGNTNLTSTGGMLGTADYMSPEQADGRPVTERCDQYSLGGVLYALAAGRPPFQAETLPELLQLQRYAEPEPLRHFAPEIPAALESVILQLLAKEPDKRFPNMMLLARQLQAMHLALSRPPSEDESELAPHTDANAHGATIEPLGDTRVYDDLEGELQLDTDRPTLKPGEVASRHTIQTPAVRQDRFTTVGEERLRERQRETRTHLAQRFGGLAIGLVLAIGFFWYALSPPSADDLFRQIASAADDDDLVKILAVEDEIDEFVERYPESIHWTDVKALQNDVALAHTERKLRARARQLGRHRDLAPIERLYVDAIRQTDDSPERAIADLEAIIVLYSDDADLSEMEAHCLELAERQKRRLDDRVNRYAPRDLRALEGRLSRADRLRAIDPGRAKRMYEAIIRLGDQKPWAEDVVMRARIGLDQLSRSRTSAPNAQAANAP